MKRIKLVLRIVATPIIAIPVIALGWLSQTLCGISIIIGLCAIVAFPFCWIADSNEGVELCCEGMEIAFYGIAYPFIWLYYFIIDTEKLKEF